MNFSVESVFEIKLVPKLHFLVLGSRIQRFQNDYHGELYIKMLRKTYRIDLEQERVDLTQSGEVNPSGILGPEHMCPSPREYPGKVSAS